MGNPVCDAAFAISLTGFLRIRRTAQFLKCRATYRANGLCRSAFLGSQDTFDLRRESLSQDIVVFGCEVDSVTTICGNDVARVKIVHFDEIR